MAEKQNNEVKLAVEKCPLTSVTVFKDRAEVSRSVETSVKAGTNELKITGLVDIEQDSIRVEGRGQATIAEVSFQFTYCNEDEASMSEKEKTLTEELKVLKEQKKSQDSEAQLSLLQKQWGVLDRFATNAARGSQDTNSGFKLDEQYFKGMKDFLQHFRDVGEQLDAETLEVKEKREEIDEKIQQVESNLQEVRGNRRRSTCIRECIIVLEAEAETAVQLKLSYVVLSASWVPSYDLRMNTEDGVLSVSYFGLISQNSGEDWTNVKLHLSTAEPSVGGTIPILPQTQVNLFKPVVHLKPKSSGSVLTFRSSARSASSTSQAYDDRLQRQASPMSAVPVKIQETTVSASYEIVRQSSIPSDNTSHKVTVGIMELKPTMTYVSIPKVVPHAFLQAKVVNTSKFTLLPGKSNIFLDNSFVAKAELQAVAPKEEFECSLGVDPGVRVTYKPLVKVNSSSGIISRVKVVSHEQAIEVKNVHNYPVTVAVKDNLPRSLDEKVKVVLQSPYIDAKHPEKSEATLTVDNTVVWEVKVGALNKSDLLLKYSIELPMGEDLDYKTY
ncbi:protein F37C4.5 isoform X1 [Aplysia californica]|uniref:Protein F37C4.5 isoform X1 n=1 Tax=Aplysia californica TaxID=6500 RepID=A0ABM0ZYP6_APLCA|nr:protein F37C4.5 isoform X1 [Aplysia californica]XP_012937278.1 protein F37C4.5 isoform X1 [Aplysia californica]XP_012937279.1 protein F37C4.5 isoform X1 [Aplysia californica]